MYIQKWGVERWHAKQTLTKSLNKLNYFSEKYNKFNDLDNNSSNLHLRMNVLSEILLIWNFIELIWVES